MGRLISEENTMKNRLVTTFRMIVFLAVLPATNRLFGANSETGSAGMLDPNQLLSEQAMERSRALDELAAKHHEISTALMKTLEEAKARFRMDRRYRSPLHSAILAVDAWQVTAADGLLLSILDYDLDLDSLPVGINVPGDFFYPAAGALVRLRVDVEKVERSLATAENPKTRRLLAWIFLERTRDIGKARTALADARDKNRWADEKQNLGKALELLDNPSDLLPAPARGDPPSTK
jgi:hypothetical protein